MSCHLSDALGMAAARAEVEKVAARDDEALGSERPMEGRRPLMVAHECRCRSSGLEWCKRARGVIARDSADFCSRSQQSVVFRAKNGRRSRSVREKNRKSAPRIFKKLSLPLRSPLMQPAPGGGGHPNLQGRRTCSCPTSSVHPSKHHGRLATACRLRRVKVSSRLVSCS